MITTVANTNRILGWKLEHIPQSNDLFSFLKINFLIEGNLLYRILFSVIRSVFLYKEKEKKKRKNLFHLHLAPKGSSFNLAQGQGAVPSNLHFLQWYYLSTETVKPLHVIDLLHIGLGMEIINSTLSFER